MAERAVREAYLREWRRHAGSIPRTHGAHRRVQPGDASGRAGKRQATFQRCVSVAQFEAGEYKDVRFGGHRPQLSPRLRGGRISMQQSMTHERASNKQAENLTRALLACGVA